METCQKTPPPTGLLTWLLNTILDIVFNRVPGADLAAQSVKKPVVQSPRARYDALLYKREALSSRMAKDAEMLAAIDVQIAELKRQLNL